MGSEASTPKGKAGVLDGIRVVELAQNAAVPYCGRLLAGMGADVVKVEPPGGDAMRHLGDLGSSEAKAYAAINPGKRSIVLDLGSDDAAEVLDGLFRWADVVLVGVKGSDLDRFGIGWDRVRAVNPSVVHLTHTPFGPEGPDAEVGGYDVLVQALSGTGFLMNRSQDGVPLPTRPAVNDFGTGIASALAVVAALWHRDRTGEGQRVDTSLLATALGLGTAGIHQFDADEDDLRAFRSEVGEILTQGGGFDRQRELYEGRMLQGQVAFRLYFRTYATSDGLVSVAGLSTSLYRRFHEATGITRPPSGEGPPTRGSWPWSTRPSGASRLRPPGTGWGYSGRSGTRAAATTVRTRRSRIPRWWPTTWWSAWTTLSSATTSRRGCRCGWRRPPWSSGGRHRALAPTPSRC